MSIKCSLFGHSFDEPTVEREREEQGSEVVITIREVQTCTRCGETRVVSENKEVTTLETPEDVEVEPTDDTTAVDAETSGPSQQDMTASGTTTASQHGGTADSSDGNIDSAPASQPTDAATTGAATAESGPSTADESLDSNPTVSGTSGIDGEPPVTDDAEILDDESDTSIREPGEWPQDANESEAQPDADILTEDGSDSAESNQTDAEFVTDEGSETQTNEWPSEDEIDAAGNPESAGPGAVTVPDGSYACRECGFSTPVEESSLREGDFCPECHRGTLIHVQDTN